MPSSRYARSRSGWRRLPNGRILRNRTSRAASDGGAFFVGRCGMERDVNQKPEGTTEVRLKQCDLSVCKAMCCFDGVYLIDGEEARITQVVQENPDAFSFLPDAFIVDGYWRGTSAGRKTATRPHEHQVPDFPAHFTQTKCVF